MRGAGAARRQGQRVLRRIISCNEDGPHRPELAPKSAAVPGTPVSPSAGEVDINSSSIGIEIANPGHEYGYPDFPARQIAAVTALCRSILTRHAIPPLRVLAHSDVALRAQTGSGRKISLAHAARFRGGALGPALALQRACCRSCPLGDRGAAVAALQRAALAEYRGYGVEKPTGEYDVPTGQVVTALQRHFRPVARRRHCRRFHVRNPAGPARPSREARANIRRAGTRLRTPHSPLTAAAGATIPLHVSRPDGRSGENREESPGSMDKRCRIDIRRVRAQGKCHRKKQTASARCVKLCRGKGETVR